MSKQDNNVVRHAFVRGRIRRILARKQSTREGIGQLLALAAEDAIAAEVVNAVMAERAASYEQAADDPEDAA
jgi:hypothetical protein